MYHVTEINEKCRGKLQRENIKSQDRYIDNQQESVNQKILNLADNLISGNATLLSVVVPNKLADYSKLKNVYLKRNKLKLSYRRLTKLILHFYSTKQILNYVKLNCS